ncbi:Destruxin synthetase, partial [Pyrenophora teres f. teres]
MDSPRVSEHDDRGTEKMWAWNYEIPGVTNKCIHDLFAEQVLAQPNAPAICAWDGKMSYSVLDNLSTTLAGYLVKIGVKPEDVVPLCFEKSMWTVVAMLAVLKAGGAFAPLDPDHPASRHKEILRQTSARVVLVSAQHSARWASSSCHVVTLSEASISQLTADDDLPNFSATPGNAAYILFTSGSTGIPKGVVLEHRAVSTSCLGHGRAFGITDQSRVLQFTSYTFDFCMAEIITTLLYGGCICVPSDRDRRSDLAKAINAMGANWALLTPSVAQLLNPSDVPTLKILVIGGEQVTSTDWNRWPTSVQLINGYGPTECCIVCAGYTTTQAFTTGTIGRAIASVSWVVDPENHHKLAPLGSVGELLVEGPILARGYLNDAEKTAAAFIEDPAWLMDGCQGYAGRRGRLYKTGDLVQYNDDGNLVCLGRKDSQVKLRGQRIELGEIEHHLRECLPEATQMAVEVILPSEESKHATLAAFVRLEQDYCHIPAVGILAGGNWKAQAVTISDIVDALAERLPTHMIPTIFITLEVFPMTTSGKTDRKVLREIGASFTPQQLANVRTSRQGQKRQPTTPAERAMQQLWAGVLAIAPDSIGLDDSFFRLGGDSIAAMKLVGEVRRAGIQLTVADLFRNPRLDQLTAAATASTHASPVSIPQVEHVGPVAQSFAQGRLWFLEELHPGLTWYLMPLAVRIRGPLDLPALHSALLAVERRHETLRTTFATVDGASVQVVQPFQAKDLNIIDIVPGDEQGLAEAVQQEQGTVFNLRTQPGWRVTVYRVGEHDHVLSIVMHHIISDGWSVDVLMRELAGFYSASVRGHDPLSQVQPLPVQYRDFSLWQRQQAQADEHQKQLSYWVEQLQTSRPAELLCDKPRPAALSGQAGVQSIEIAGPLYAKLQSFCQLHGVTQFVVLLAAFRTAHFRLTGQDDATIGTVNANRDRWEIKDMIGFFVNMQCLRITAGHGSFEELVQQVHEVTIASHANADVPFESIVSKLKSDRDLSRHPLVQLVFAVHAQQDLGQLNLEGVQTESLADAKTSRFDLEFHFYQQSDGLLGNILFSTDLYAPETIDNLLSVFQRVLEACLDDPQAPVASMPLLREDNYAKLDAMGLVRAEETAYPRDSSVVDLFREQAAACPSRVAVKDSVTEMTYAQLDTASDVLARWLARRSLAPETLVGVFASRSCEAIVAFLGILKANLAYLPFDVKIPRKRMEDILSSLPGHRIILVGVGAQPPSTELSNIELVGIREALDEQTKTKAGKHTLAVCSGPSATSLAYVMFTSGSTGMPKGVMAEHRGIVRLAVLQMFREHCIRTAYMAPSLFRSYILQAPALFTGLDMLCVGGEAVHPADLVAAKQYLTGKGAVRKRHSHRPRPQQLGAFVMDAKLQLVPLGVVGELVVTGDGLARGYTDPARNIDRFVSVEIGGKTVRAYRTGDYVRHRPTDGQLEFFGRMDGQVKIRGNRVELGEVEHALRSDKAVREAVAVLQQHDGSEARLAGFVTVHEDAETADEHVDDSNESQHVDVWEDKFDADIYSPIDNVQKENIGRDFVGWTSMYDGSDIDKAEMNEWLDDTIDTMLNGQRPGNVLEIGSGTGMILFNLGDGLQSYVGLDPSRKAVQFIAETAKSIPGLAGKIRMYKATAADVGRLEQPVAASLVVINSVVQYFPSLDYLFKTVQQLVELEGTRTLFFGDVRSYALHREFLATRAVHMAGDRATKADIRRMVADMERVERELLVDPAFFTALPSRLPGLVDHVEILPKKMKATNELSCYRYAAVVHLTPRDGQARELAVREVADDRWIDFAERRLDRQSLLQQLHGLSTSPTIAVSNIPYSKTMVSRCLVRSLEGAEGETSDSPDWLASVHQQTQDCRSLSAAELVELAQEADCRVEISWSRQHSQQGGLDAIFHRYQPLTGERVMFRFPTDHAERPLHSLSSKPLRQQFLQKTQQRLVEMLEAQLPTYMVPQTLTVLDAMPVNPNGKVDRKALEQQADTQSNHSGQKQQPSTPAERAMQQLWAGVLAIAPDSIGLDDSFFRLGGDSIAAMKLVGEARRAGIQLTVADLFRNPRLDQLTAAATASTHASPVSIPQVEHVGPVAQSFAQGRLWFLEELHPGLTWYLMPLAVRIRGPLDLPALHSALLAVERRHETLRTTFATVDGASVQVVQPFQAKDLNIIDIVPGDEQGLTEAVQQEQGTVFNLRTQPGWRVTVYRVGEHDHVLSIVMHHIISDGWSVDVLMRELAGFYSASVRGHDPLSQVQPLPVQYRDFSLWQRQQAQADEHQKQLSYWVEQLQTSRPAELLCDKPRPAALSGQAGVQSIEIAGPLYAKLQSFCQLHGVTQFVVLLAAFRTAHFRLTGQDDATIGTVNANRDRWEIKDMIGFFVNMQCLRITAGHGSFEELVQQVHEVTIVLTQMRTFDLEFHFYQQSDGLLGNILFSTDLYAPETIDNLLSVFQRVLEACLDDPQAPVASMPLLREDNYAKLDAMGLVRAEETAYPRDSSVVDLFREQAAACPSRVAVKDSVTEMTYAQLDTASDVLARWLARRSLAPETLVGVFASRSCEAIVAFLGILKANLAYLPFDVKIPRKRMEDILSSLPGHRIILVGVGAQPPSTELSNIELVGIREALDEQAKTKAGKHTLAVCSGPSATSLAYVMFTSGSTGMPKGVMAEHRGIVRLVRDNNLVQHLPDSPVMAHMANLAFDASTWEIYSTLLRGGTLVCIGAAMVLDAEAVLQMFREHCIRTAYMAPSLFRSYILQAPALFTGLDMLCVGGEAVHPADLVAAKQYLTGKGAVRKRHSHRPRPQQLGAFVMDAKLQLVPLGVVGELVVTGDGLARGYTDPARNIDRFVSVEIGGKTVRAYRTGDYVRHRPTDGQLEFFGRMDGQVKIRGNRVELGEVEHALRSDKAVREAVAVLQQHDGSEARLAGNESQHVDVWEDKFDADIYSPIDNVQKENIGRDFVGWTSMYDGSDIDKAEMNEWLDDTIDTMLNGQRPGNVLEIGSGTGMILFNLGDGLQSYVGLDPSRKAVQFIAETAKSIPGLAGRSA